MGHLCNFNFHCFKSCSVRTNVHMSKTDILNVPSHLYLLCVAHQFNKREGELGEQQISFKRKKHPLCRLLCD